MDLYNFSNKITSIITLYPKIKAFLGKHKFGHYNRYQYTHRPFPSNQKKKGSRLHIYFGLTPSLKGRRPLITTTYILIGNLKYPY